MTTIEDKDFIQLSELKEAEYYACSFINCDFKVF